MKNTSSLINQLRDICPSIAFFFSKDRDWDAKWDGDGPDPRTQGLTPYTITVSGYFVARGNCISAKDSLGECYYSRYEEIGDVHGYLPDMIAEVLKQLAHRIESTPSLDAELAKALDFVLAVQIARNSAQEGVK